MTQEEHQNCQNVFFICIMTHEKIVLKKFISPHEKWKKNDKNIMKNIS